MAAALLHVLDGRLLSVRAFHSGLIEGKFYFSISPTSPILATIIDATKMLSPWINEFGCGHLVFRSQVQILMQVGIFHPTQEANNS